MKNSIKIFLILITSLLLINLVNASSIIMISSKYETKIKCDEMRKKNTDDNKITVKYSRSECYLKKGKYVYNVCNSGTSFCPTGDNDNNYSSQQSTSNNEDVPYKGVLDELLRVVKIKKSEKTDNDYEKFLISAKDYVDKLGEKDKYKNNPKTKAVISYLQTGLDEIKQDFDKNKNNQDLYDLLCDLGSCDKNNFVNNNNNNRNSTNDTINSSEEVCFDEEKKIAFNKKYKSIYNNYKKFYAIAYKNFYEGVSPSLESFTFKIFFPKGAQEVVLRIYFMGMLNQTCASGINVKYWINKSIPEANIKKGYSFNDVWEGKYMTTTFYGEDNHILFTSKDGKPSEEAKWIYFSIDMPCEHAYIDARSNISKLDINKYTDWYNNTKWEENGDPAYECGIVEKEKPKGKIDGKCGYEAGKVIFEAIVGLCDEGEYRLTNEGWQCLGYNGGNNAECSAIGGHVVPNPMPIDINANLAKCESFNPINAKIGCESMASKLYEECKNMVSYMNFDSAIAMSNASYSSCQAKNNNNK